jgi:lipopolysaccharide transport system permease protein
VFFRDLGNAVGPLVQLLFFLSPIIYTMQRFEGYPLMSKLLWVLNPFVTLVETARGLLIEGVMPDWRAFGLVTTASVAVATAGYAFFMKVRRYFADAM